MTVRLLPRRDKVGILQRFRPTEDTTSSCTISKVPYSIRESKGVPCRMVDRDSCPDVCTGLGQVASSSIICSTGQLYLLWVLAGVACFVSDVTNRELDGQRRLSNNPRL